MTWNTHTDLRRSHRLLGPTALGGGAMLWASSPVAAAVVLGVGAVLSVDGLRGWWR